MTARYKPSNAKVKGQARTSGTTIAGLCTSSIENPHGLEGFGQQGPDLRDFAGSGRLLVPVRVRKGPVVDQLWMTIEEVLKP